MKNTAKHTFDSRIFRRLAPAFSLFEVLMFVAILGVMVSLTIPMFGNVDTMYATRDRRNAQELASICMTAQAAGLDFVQGGSVLDTVREIVRGGMPVRGALRGHLFVVPGLSEEDIAGAAKYLIIQEGELRYTNTSDVQDHGDQSL